MLRDYQLEAIQSLRRSLSSGKRAPVLVGSPGFGKTIVASEIARSALEKGNRTLVLAPRRELVHQPSRTLSRAGIEHGIILSGEEPDGTADVQVASWDTLRSWLRREKIPAPEAQLIIVDEVQLLTKRRCDLLREHWPDARVVGLTATPARQTGLSLGDYFDDLVFGPSMRELMDAGYLLDVDYYAPSDPDLSKLRIAQGDYKLSDIEARFDQPELVGDVVSHWWRFASDRQTVVFAGTVAHATHLRDRFLESGVTADLLHCHLPINDRRAVLDRVESGETRVLCNVDIVSLGWDQPSISCAVIARPTKSPVRYIQTAGRILRPCEGQHRAMLIDHCGVVNELGLLDDERPWSLTSKGRVQDRQAKRKCEQTEGKITCGHCEIEYDGQRNCPNCGWLPPEKSRAPVAIDGELAEVDRKARKANGRKWSMGEKRRFFGELRGVARQRGYKDGWSVHAYQERIGALPWPVYDEPAREPSKETLAWCKHLQIKRAKAREKAA